MQEQKALTIELDALDTSTGEDAHKGMAHLVICSTHTARSTGEDSSYLMEAHSKQSEKRDAYEFDLTTHFQKTHLKG